jgi:hypothetical protein
LVHADGVADTEAVVDVLVILKDDEVEVGDSETQRTWPMERSQFVSKVGLKAYSCASVMPNSVQIA